MNTFDAPAGFEVVGGGSSGGINGNGWSVPSTCIELPAVIDGGNVQEFVNEVVWPAFITERRRLNHFSIWARGHQPDYLVSPSNNVEKRALLALSKTPWLRLVISTFTQALYVDGYKGEGSKINSPKPWATWCANGLPSRQIGIHRAAMTYGYSYAKAILGEVNGVEQAVLRGLSPRNCYALWEDPIADDYPMYALELMQHGKGVRFYTADNYYELDMPSDGDFPNAPVEFGHNAGVVPIVRYLNEVDLDGFVLGEVESLIRSAIRVDKTDYDRLLIQHYNSWKVRTATGIDDLADVTDDVARAAKVKLEQDGILAHTNPEARFSTLPETSMSGIIDAHNTDVQTLAANAQLPAHLLTGSLANLSAEALSAARGPTTQKLYERQMTFGQSHGQLLRLAAHIEGDDADAKDFTALVTWQDMEVRSLAQAVDAYGKAAALLGVPKEYLWGKIPGFTQADVESMRQHLLDSDPESKFLRSYGMAPGVGGGPPAVAGASGGVDPVSQVLGDVPGSGGEASGGGM